MTAPKCVGCPFRRDCPGCPWSGESPAAATVSAPVSEVACETMEPLARTRETPAKARTDRGRGPTFKESNVNDRTPQRIQRKRSKGWKMPEGAVYVGRPTLLGNPFRVIRSTCCPTVDVVDDNGMTYVIDHEWSHANGWSDLNRPGAWKWAQGEAVRLFSADLTYWWGGRLLNDERLRDAVNAIRGKDLACWRPLDQPCHADVLLEIANGGNA